MKIFLVGYMGCGKSRWGKELARMINKEFIDLDKLIEQQQGISISEIFDTLGEDAFREIEHTALRSLALRDGVVVATGGGTPCFRNNMDLMNQCGITLFLQVEEDILISRILNSKQERPIVKDMSRKQLSDFVNQHLKIRLPYYLKSRYVLPASNLKLANLIDVFSGFVGV